MGLTSTTITKIMRPPVNNVMKNTVGIRQMGAGPKNIFGNTAPSAESIINKGHQGYLKSLREPNMKTSGLDEKLAEIVSRLVSPDLVHRVQNIGNGKVAKEVVEASTGTDYGRIEDLNLVKAAAILGTKLAMSRREFKGILDGLKGLRDLE